MWVITITGRWLCLLCWALGATYYNRLIDGQALGATYYNRLIDGQAVVAIYYRLLVGYHLVSFLEFYRCYRRIKRWL
jgi:hypothetical protein